MTVPLLALLLLAVLLAELLALVRGLPRIPLLAGIPPARGDALPRVSIVVSALNEEATVEPALRSLLALDYPALEVIAIDDRSTDATGAILDRLAASEPRLRVVHVRELPAGWLGKNHALHLGAAAASGELLLFTDADVHFEAQSLRRAVAHLQAQVLDHLVVMPDLTVRGPLLAAVLLNFYAGFFATLPPWKLGRSRKVYVGMGAFNLVRAEAYRRTGGHAALRMEVVDDMLLGKRLKLQGFRQELVLGRGTVALEWYPDTRALVRGLEKNSFAAVEYSVLRALAGSLVLVAMRIAPTLGLVLTQGPARWLCAACCAVNLLVHARILRITDWPRRAMAWWPLSPAVMLFVLWRAVLLTWLRGGVVWRGTLYPLDALRRGHVN